MENEIINAKSLFNKWVRRIKLKENLVQKLHKEHYMMAISNPLEELHGSVDKIIVKVKAAHKVLETTFQRTEILENMKAVRADDMIVKKYPFYYYNQLLPLVVRYC